MVNRKYNRIFVLMTGKNAGQSLNGSCDMEVINGRGRLYAYVGKLNKLTYKPRKLYLISVGLMGSLAVSAGSLQPKGRNASIEAEFNPNDLFGSGMTFEEINAVAIWGEEDGPNNAVLEGFVTKRLNWHSNLDIFGETTSDKISHTEAAILKSAEAEKKTVTVSTMEKTEKLCRNIITESEHKEEQAENINELEEVNELEDINELEEVDESEDINELEEVDESENINELEEVDESEDINELEKIEEDEEIPVKVTEKVKKEVKEDVSEIAQKLAVNINKADKLKGMSAAEAVAKMSPHDTFRAISEKFRKELDMLDQMGIIDKKMFFGDEQEEKTSSTAETVSKAETEVKTMPETAVAQPEENVEEIKIVENNDETEYRIPINEMTPADRLFVTNDKLITDDGREWIKIDYREAYFINDAIKDIRSLFVKNAARKGRHMIIGRDGRSLFIGIPGQENERSSAEQHGFYDFLIVKNVSEAGYWIKAI